MMNNQVVCSLNETARANPVVFQGVLWGILCVAAAMIIALVDPIYAESIIGESGNDILQDLKWWVAVGGVAFGVLQIVKGRMAAGIIGMVVTGVVFAFCASPSTFGSLGDSLLSIFGL